MTSHTTKYAAAKFRLAIPILMIALGTSPVPANAGVIDTVNNKVTNILNRVKTIGSNTNGFGDFVTTLRDVRDSMGGGMISDIRETIGETQDLIQFIKDRRDSAGQTSQYPSLPVLVQSLGRIADILLERDGQAGGLDGLSALLAVLPDRSLAPVARAVSRVGVDSDFVAKIDQMGTDLAELRDILEQTAVLRDSGSQVAGDYWIQDTDLYHAEFGCHIYDSTRLVRLSQIARKVKKVASFMKFKGAMIDAKGKVIKVKKGVGIFGWVSMQPTTDTQGTIAQVMEIQGDKVLGIVDEAEKIIENCRDKFEAN